MYTLLFDHVDTEGTAAGRLHTAVHGCVHAVVRRDRFARPWATKGVAEDGRSPVHVRMEFNLPLDSALIKFSLLSDRARLPCRMHQDYRKGKRPCQPSV